MNRRSFFSVLAGATAASFDPERLLWVPGRKLVSIPKQLAPFSRDSMLMLLQASLEYQRQYNAMWSGLIEQANIAPRPPWATRIGYTIAVRRPERFQEVR